MEREIQLKNSIEEYIETMDIKKVALKMSIPMVISMISIALYGIIDTIFVSNLSQKALNAISLAYPIQNIITAIGLGIGIGVNVVLSKAIGERQEEKTQKIMVNGIIITFIVWIVIALIAMGGINVFFNFFTQDMQVVELGVSYLKIISVLSIGTLFQILFEKILEAHGKTKESMLVQIVGAIINLLLDPLLIYGKVGFPQLGIKGAAIATVIGQVVRNDDGDLFSFKK